MSRFKENGPADTCVCRPWSSNAKKNAKKVVGNRFQGNSGIASTADDDSDLADGQTQTMKMSHFGPAASGLKFIPAFTSRAGPLETTRGAQVAKSFMPSFPYSDISLLHKEGAGLQNFGYDV